MAAQCPTHLNMGFLSSLFMIIASNMGPSRTTNSIIRWITQSRFLWRQNTQHALCGHAAEWFGSMLTFPTCISQISPKAHENKLLYIIFLFPLHMDKHCFINYLDYICFTQNTSSTWATHTRHPFAIWGRLYQTFDCDPNSIELILSLWPMYMWSLKVDTWMPILTCSTSSSHRSHYHISFNDMGNS